MSDCATCGQQGGGDSTHVCRGLAVTCLACGQPVGDQTHVCPLVSGGFHSGSFHRVVMFSGMSGGKTAAMREFLRRHPRAKVIYPRPKP